MKSKHLLAISLLGAASWLGAQNLDWYTYWGSDAAGSEITPRKIRVDRQGDIYAAATFGGTEVDIMGEKTASNSSVSNGDAVIVKLGADNGRDVQILSGVKPGDRVVVEGAYHVKLASASNAIPAHTHEH